jgi:arginine/lysine/ornithine decarboxylase
VTTERQQQTPYLDALCEYARRKPARTYPPGIPSVLPGERLTAQTLDYIQSTLEQGGSVRGASDRLLRTVRVVVEDGSRPR